MNHQVVGRINMAKTLTFDSRLWICWKGKRRKRPHENIWMLQFFCVALTEIKAKYYPILSYFFSLYYMQLHFNPLEFDDFLPSMFRCWGCPPDLMNRSPSPSSQCPELSYQAATLTEDVGQPWGMSDWPLQCYVFKTMPYRLSPIWPFFDVIQTFPHGWVVTLFYHVLPTLIHLRPARLRISLPPKVRIFDLWTCSQDFMVQRRPSRKKYQRCPTCVAIFCRIQHLKTTMSLRITSYTSPLGYLQVVGRWMIQDHEKLKHTPGAKNQIICWGFLRRRYPKSSFCVLDFHGFSIRNSIHVAGLPTCVVDFSGTRNGRKGDKTSRFRCFVEVGYPKMDGL